MSKNLRIVLAQLNWKIGDIDYNLEKHIESANFARDQLKADVIVFSELSITGYPPEDLLYRKSFLTAVNEAIQTFKTKVKDIYCIIGHPHGDTKCLFNACSVIYNGEVLALYYKQHLPNYSVFDEERYFEHGSTHGIVDIKGVPVGLVICEDLWVPEPTAQAVREGAALILSPNASPFEIDKDKRRLTALTKRVNHNKVPIAYVNQVGGQDDLIFDGGSLVINKDGKVCQSAGYFQEKLLPVDFVFDEPYVNIASNAAPSLNNDEKIYQALTLSLKDYVEKNHFKSVILGLSGGIDSALTATIAFDALGKDRVFGLLMPSRFTSLMSMEDANLIAQKLGIQTHTINIDSLYQSFLDTLSPTFQKQACNVAEENIQARIRAILLMALSNKFGHLVLSTGNRSELAVGYCTLYGDMAGGFAVLKDVPKTLVYELAKYRNQIAPVIPKRVIDRAPTAELAPNQTDQDTLPPYPVLDQILDRYLNREQSIAEIIAAGIDEKIVNQIVDLIRQNEYKRRQGAIGPRINFKAFGRDRRYPITNGFKG